MLLLRLSQEKAHLCAGILQFLFEELVSQVQPSRFVLGEVTVFELQLGVAFQLFYVIFLHLETVF